MAEYIVNPEEERLFYGNKYEELIRCKGCRYMIKGQDAYTKEYFYNCNHWQADTVPDGFCHKAEKEGVDE